MLAIPGGALRVAAADVSDHLLADAEGNRLRIDLGKAAQPVAVAAAARQDRPIIVVDEQDAAALTATLQMPDEPQSARSLKLHELFERLERRLPVAGLFGATVFEHQHMSGLQLSHTGKQRLTLSRILMCQAVKKRCRIPA